MMTDKEFDNQVVQVFKAGAKHDALSASFGPYSVLMQEREAMKALIQRLMMALEAAKGDFTLARSGDVNLWEAKRRVEDALEVCRGIPWL